MFLSSVVQTQGLPSSTSKSVSAGDSKHAECILRVVDVTGAPVLSLDEEKISTKDIGWLRQQLMERISSSKVESASIYIWCRFGDWIQDDVKLASIQGTTQEATKTTTRGTKGSARCGAMAND